MISPFPYISKLYSALWKEDTIVPPYDAVVVNEWYVYVDNDYSLFAVFSNIVRRITYR